MQNDEESIPAAGQVAIATIEPLLLQKDQWQRWSTLPHE
jgi:hypothetical protein